VTGRESWALVASKRAGRRQVSQKARSWRDAAGGLSGEDFVDLEARPGVKALAGLPSDPG